MDKPNTVFSPFGPVETRVIDEGSNEALRARLVEAMGAPERATRVRSALDVTRAKLAHRKSFQSTKETFSGIIAEVRDKANAGDAEALEMLYHIARESAVALTEHGAHDFNSLRRFARRQFGWPMLVFSYAAPRNQIIEAVEALQPGSSIESPVDLQAFFKKHAAATPARAWVGRLALQVHDVKRGFEVSSVRVKGAGLIEGSTVELPADFYIKAEDVAQCLKLPALTTDDDSQQAWLKFALEVAKKACGGKLTKHPGLGSIGDQEANSSKRAFKKGVIRPANKLDGTWTSIAEGAIRKAIKGALESMAIKPTQEPAN